MATSPASPQVFRFGAYEFEPHAGELRKQGLRIRLEGQPVAILRMLLERPGELVTRDELQKKLWPADTFVDFEHSLNAAVKRLRAALNDSPDAPRYIETLVGRGYRFIAPVNSAAAVDLSTTPEKTLAPRAFTRPSRVSLRSAMFVAGGLLLAGVVSWSWRELRHRSTNPTPPAIHSLAVLPLENLSGDFSQEYFADGMTDALITDLAQIGSLRVISRTSVMGYKGARKPLPDIARELNVDGIVEGTVMRSGNRVRITSQLIYAPSDQHLWARSYERDLGDVVVLQGEVAESIAAQVRATLSPQQRARLGSARPVNPVAYELYLQGQSYFNRQTPGGMKQAIGSFEKAVELDPNFALAYAGMAEAYASSSVIGPFPANESFPKAKAAATKALTLDPLLADAHAVLGMEMASYEFDRPGAQREFLRAIELSPNSAKAHRRYAGYLNTMRRHAEAIAEMKKAVELDPWSPVMSNFLAIAYELAGDYDRAFEQYRHAIEMDPNYGQGRLNFADLLAYMGRYEQSITEFEKGEVLLGMSPDEAVQSATALRRAFRTSGAKGYWKEYLALELRTINKPNQQWFQRVDVAAVYARLGDKDKAFVWLQQAYQAREGILLGMINSDASFKNLRGDPRYSDLLRRLGLPE